MNRQTETTETKAPARHRDPRDRAPLLALRAPRAPAVHRRRIVESAAGDASRSYRAKCRASAAARSPLSPADHGPVRDGARRLEHHRGEARRGRGQVFDAGTLLFPLTYLIGDVLTEVYGYRRARLVIWVGFVVQPRRGRAIQIAIHLPPAGLLGREPGRVRDGARHDLAPLPRLARRLPRRRVLELARPRAAEGRDQRPLALDSHDLLDVVGAGPRLGSSSP